MQVEARACLSSLLFSSLTLHQDSMEYQPRVNLDNPYELPLTVESISALFFAEADFRSSLPPVLPYLPALQTAINSIYKAQESCQLNSKLIYLTLNYLHGFLSLKRQKSYAGISASKLQLKEEKWGVDDIDLITACCLQVAAKMIGVSFSASDFSKALKVDDFEDERMEWMELELLRVLDSEMASLSPFAFHLYFISLFCPANSELLDRIRDRSNAILTYYEFVNEISDYKPSVIAAATVVHAAREVCPEEFPAYKSLVCSCGFLSKVELEKCCEELETFHRGNREDQEKQDAAFFDFQLSCEMLF